MTVRTRVTLFLVFAVAFARVLSAPAVEAVSPDTVTLGFRNLPFSLEPHVLELNARLVNANIFDALVHRTAQGELEPSLATSWRSLGDTALEFQLRRGVSFTMARR